MTTSTAERPSLRKEPAFDWRDDAACLSVDPELFFPNMEHRVGGRRQLTRESQDAIAICNGCSVQGDCLKWALEHGEVGIWGGTTTDKRRQISHQMKEIGARS